MEERIQKILSRAGLGSRRACEELITAGRVRVNGQTAQLGDKANPATDRITLDGRLIAAPEEPVYIAVYKPRGVISAVTSPDRRQTVRDLVPLPAQLVPVGRLDVDSEGLMLMTNDGELTNRLTHPRYGHEKEYRVLVARRPDEEQLHAWRRGVVLDDGYQTQPADVQYEGSFGKGAWLRVTLREGRKRQIRETGQRIGLPVVRIIRVRIGSLLLGSLKPREWRHLTEQEVSDLRAGKPPRQARTGGRSAEKSERPQRGTPRSPAARGRVEGPGRRPGAPRGAERRNEEEGDRPDRRKPPGAGRTRGAGRPGGAERGPGAGRPPGTGPRTGPGGRGKPQGRPGASDRGAGPGRPPGAGPRRGPGGRGDKGGRRER
jgi:23S rRNA pseudouridine2605 synthase